ncbi:MAG: hypothetical protein JRK53_18025 [Deltaproteobacteria bacterium]|nr:hypothetical protein [Deltaproteobacteria bacterium]MBW2284534.1 hypothetical protein [Deltaproteobacteria bacterium]
MRERLWRLESTPRMQLRVLRHVWRLGSGYAHTLQDLWEALARKDLLTKIVVRNRFCRFRCGVNP